MRQLRPPYRPGRARRLAGAGLAVLLTAGSLALNPGLAPAAVAEEEGGGALEQPFGDPIEPGTSFADTAEVDIGTYALPVPEPEADHYFEIQRTEPGEVIWYGVTTQTGDSLDYATLSAVGTADGDSTETCNQGQIPNNENVSYLTLLASANRSANCREADSIVITVSNLELADESVPTDAYYQLVIWREPPLSTSDQLPGPSEISTWTPMRAEGEPQEVAGAGSFTEAEPLADGTYRTTVRKGTPAIFAFPMTFGQHAQVQAEVSEGESFNAGGSLDPIWISPLGGELRRVEPAGGPTSGLNVSGDNTAGWATPIVTFSNRQRPGGIGASSGANAQAAAPAAFAGTYFLALELPGGEFSGENFPDEMTIDLTVATITDYEASPPEYATDPPPLSALDGSGYVATSEEEQAAAQDSAEPAPWPLVAGLFGGAALLALVGGVAVGRVLRSRS